jgi:excisionase family DNA binding protein
LALCCTEKHIYQLVQNGQLKDIRIGKRGIRVDRQSVENFIQEHLIDPIEYYA